MLCVSAILCIKKTAFFFVISKRKTSHFAISESIGGFVRMQISHICRLYILVSVCFCFHAHVCSDLIIHTINLQQSRKVQPSNCERGL